MNRELVTGLAQLSAEKGLPKEVVGDIIARALKRAYGAEENIDVKVDITTGAFRVFLLKTVVEKVGNVFSNPEAAHARGEIGVGREASFNGWGLRPVAARM